MIREMKQTSPHTILGLSGPDAQGTAVTLRVCACACGAVRVTRTLHAAFLPDVNEAVIERTPGKIALSEEEDCYRAHCGRAILRIGKQRGDISFFSPEGKVLLRENEKRPFVMEEKPVYLNRFRGDEKILSTRGADGVRAGTRAYETYEARKACAFRLFLDFSPEEALYGLGSHEEGYANLRGKSRDLYQHNLKAVVPMLVSTGGWGLLLDLGCLSAFHDDAEGSCLWADCADEMDYYFLPGSYSDVCRAYAALTGKAPLLPRYAFGYVQSKERYTDAGELLEVAREYRRRRVPLDVIVQDWQSWPEGQWGYKAFDPVRYPDPRALTDTLHDMGVRLMISVWPSMQGDDNADRKEMLENGCMLGNRVIYDAFSPKARALYWKQAREGLFRFGVDAWWCDCSEPFESDWHGALKPEPFERVLMNTREAKEYLDPGKICLYSLYHSMGLYQGQRETTRDKRVLNLTRSSWAGQHRYGTVTWSGDVSATWETLRRQVPEGLNFMATGEGWWTTDAGGFFPAGCGGAWFGAGDFPDGVKDLGYRELYVRWLQLAAFLPMMRSHGTGTPREIWRFGEKGDPWYDAIEKIIRLRSSMVPHWYSLAAQYCCGGMPPVRVPALMFPDDPMLKECGNEMLVGDSLLVRPVTRPMYRGPGGCKIPTPDTSEAVYLPSGCLWHPWMGGACLQGGQTVSVSAPLDTVPLFVRAGGIVLTGPVRQHVDEQPCPPLTVTVYSGADGTFIWYDDAGDGYGYEQGECARVTLTWHDRERMLTLSAREGSWPGMAKETELFVRLAGGESVRAVYDGRPLSVSL